MPFSKQRTARSIPIDSAINSELNPQLEKGVTNNIIKSNVLFAKLWDTAKTISGNGDIQFKILYGSNNGGSYDPTTYVRDLSHKDKITMGRLKVKYYEWTLRVEDALVADDVAKSAQFGAVADEVESAQSTAKNALNADLFSDGSGTKINGLADIFNPTTYAGVAVADLPAWAPGLLLSTVGSLTEATFIEHLNSLTRGADKPDLILTTSALYSAIVSTWFKGKVMLQADKGLLELGFDNVKYNGAVIAFDESVTAGDMHFLNLNYLKLRTNKNRPLKLTPWREAESFPGIMSALGWHGNLVCNNRRMQGKLSGVTGIAA